jgi:hypothetical protein
MRAARPLLVLLAFLGACGDNLTLPSDAAPAAIIPISGDRQSATVGSSLSEPLAVRVTDATGRPVVGAAVRFRIAGGPKVSLSDSSAATDDRGEGAVGLKLGSTPGTIVVEAVVIGAGGVELKVRFTITALGASTPPGATSPTPSPTPPAPSPPPASGGGSGGDGGHDHGGHAGGDNHGGDNHGG